MITFEWDSDKNSANKKKHGILFEDAVSVFMDERAIVYDDIDHADIEERYIILGFDARDHLLVVVHCYREFDTVIRIISARPATRTEKGHYFNRSGRW